MAGQRVDAKMDVCLMDELELLLVQEDEVSTPRWFIFGFDRILISGPRQMRIPNPRLLPRPSLRFIKTTFDASKQVCCPCSPSISRHHDESWDSANLLSHPYYNGTS